MATTSPTLYDLLGVSQDASQEQIKQAYRRQQRVTHPDASGSTHTQHLFIMITNAFNVLSDPAQRKAYDASMSSQAHGSYDPSSSVPRTATPASSQDTPRAQTPPAAKPFSPYIPRGLAAENYTPAGVDYVHMKTLGIMMGIVNAIIFGVFALAGSIKEAAIVYGVVLAVCALYAFTRRGKILFSLIVAALATLAFVMFASLMGSVSSIMQNLPNMIALGIAFGAVGSLMYIAVKIRVGRWNVDPRNTTLLNMEATQHKIWGSPGGELDDATAKFGEDKVSKGIIGERKTALGLEALLSIPGVRIFHGLRYPVGNTRADVDHLVLCGDKIALIDSKYWSGAAYAWDGYGTILENDKHVQKGVTHFPKAVDAYAKIFQPQSVRGWVLVHPNNGRPVACDNTLNQGVLLGTEQQVLNDLIAWFKEGHDGHVNRRTMHQVISWMKK